MFCPAAFRNNTCQLHTTDAIFRIHSLDTVTATRSSSLLVVSRKFAHDSLLHPSSPELWRSSSKMRPERPSALPLRAFCGYFGAQSWFIFICLSILTQIFNGISRPLRPCLPWPSLAVLVAFLWYPMHLIWHLHAEITDGADRPPHQSIGVCNSLA